MGCRIAGSLRATGQRPRPSERKWMNWATNLPFSISDGAQPAAEVLIYQLSISFADTPSTRGVSIRQSIKTWNVRNVLPTITTSEPSEKLKWILQTGMICFKMHCSGVEIGSERSASSSAVVLWLCLQNNGLGCGRYVVDEYNESVIQMRETLGC